MLPCVVLCSGEGVLCFRMGVGADCVLPGKPSLIALISSGRPMKKIKHFSS